LQTAAAVLAVHEVPVTVMHEVRERSAFSCDIGSPPDVLARRFPRHEFAHLPAQWWPEGIDTPEATIARADEFRQFMASRDDHETTVLVSHWGFILSLTGISAANGEILEYDPRQKAPERILWRP
jgi:broad specificity phosphatase PhoE